MVIGCAGVICMDERVKLGFEFAKEIATQLITLSTGFLALTITFTKEFVAAIPRKRYGWLIGAWILHVVAICSGVWSLLALTGTLMPVTPDGKPLNALSLGGNVRLPFELQIFSFAAGTALIVIYAVISLQRSR
jgi:hypothetical protein